MNNQFNFVMYMEGKVVAFGDTSYLPRIGEAIIRHKTKFRVVDVEYYLQDCGSSRAKVNIIVRKDNEGV